MKISSSKIQRAFTLVEVLVVITIIAVLTTFTAGAFNYVEAQKRDQTAKVIVNRLLLELERYQTNTGLIPEDAKDPKLSSNQVYKVLFGDSRNSGKPDDGSIVYFEDLDPRLYEGKDSAGGGKTKLIEKRDGVYLILDPWGQPYRFCRGFNEGGPSTAKNPSFDVWSIGKDGINGTSDDIYK